MSPPLRCFFGFEAVLPKFHKLYGQSRGDNISDGRGVKASASGAVDSSLIPSRVKPMTLKLAFTASLFDAQH